MPTPPPPLPPPPTTPGPGASTTEAAVPPVVQVTRALAVGSLLGLIVLGLVWELWLAPTGSGTLVIKVLPLLIPLVGLLKHRMYTYRWVSLLVWLYFLEGAVRANGAEPGWGPTLAMLQVLLCLLLFVACTVHVRWRLKHRPAL